MFTYPINFLGAKDDIPRDGLIGEWLFDGNADDTSGNGNDGIVNGPTLTQDRYSNPNSAYNFIKTNSDYIDISTIGHHSIISISLWFKKTTNPNGGLFAKGVFTGQHGDYRLNVNQLGQLVFGINANAIKIIRDGSVIDSLWHHVVGIVAESQIMLYHNGILYDSIFAPSLDNNYNEVRIGQYYSSALSNNGDIDDVRLYNRKLTSEEITALFNE